MTSDTPYRIHNRCRGLYAPYVLQVIVRLWRAGAHEQYLDFILKGAMLEQDAGELQRELSHLLSALIQLQPLLRSLQLEVKIMPCHICH